MRKRPPEAPLYMAALHRQVDRLYPGDDNREFRDRLKQTTSISEFYRIVTGVAR